MKYDRFKHHRRSIRLRGYDYSQAGYYFVTICCYQRQLLFGEIVNSAMQLNQYGEIVENEWIKSSVIRPEIKLDEYIIMPNHFHGIVIINPVGAKGLSPLPSSSIPTHPSMKPRSLSSLMTGFKSAVTKKINIIRNAPGTPVWQRNYYGAYKPRPSRARSAPHEHIIRNERSLNNIRQYIINNPLSWHVDQLHPDNPSKW